jgi:hypothetical protein
LRGASRFALSRRANQLPSPSKGTIFADLDPPQPFALRADEILGNERQTGWRSGRALQAFCWAAAGARCRRATRGRALEPIDATGSTVSPFHFCVALAHYFFALEPVLPVFLQATGAPRVPSGDPEPGRDMDTAPRTSRNRKRWLMTRMRTQFWPDDPSQLGSD